MPHASPAVLAPAVLTLAVAALAGCAGIRYDDQHADAPTRMRAVAVRLQEDFRSGGMAGVTTDIETCYQQTTLPLIRRYALEDCMALDYAGYQTDVIIGRGQLKGPALPYFEDQTFSARAAKYGHLAGFDSPPQLTAFLRATFVLVSQDMAQLNAGPIIITHPPVAPKTVHSTL